ncbi:MAG: riboflavin synthase [Gemmatimonadetes bacterium]|nr:riboflavin synthase [Gemmatimonadota bacterium]MYD24241.1 riboflavin synthase [Gemmatimonadota bacterium]MYI98516.1 riboflavin synthase [Gemmatimonadota bacterium]
MFTGIVETTGVVRSLDRVAGENSSDDDACKNASGDNTSDDAGEAAGTSENLPGDDAGENASGGLRLTVEAPSMAPDFEQGASVAVNGVCLTVVETAGEAFSVEIVPETVSRTTFGSLKPGHQVNLERPLRLSDRIDGHLVQGHVDGVGRIAAREERDNSLWYEVEIPDDLTPFVIEKGSIALDGISLTIAGLTGSLAAVSIIPHTASITTFGGRQIGDKVNIEVDMIGRYVASLLHAGGDTSQGAHPGPSPITESWLKERM